MNIQVDQIQIRLPAHLERMAVDIAQGVAESLALVSIEGGLTDKPINIVVSSHSREAHHEIIETITQQLRRGDR